MNVNGYALNTQYQKTQLSYDMLLSKVDTSKTSTELLEENSETSEANLHVVYMSEENLNSSEMLSKLILEATYSKYSATNSTQALFPNIKTTNSEEIPKEIQAYANQSKLPDGLIYTSSSEYYEKTTFDFSGEIKIITPEGEYNIELNLSYTQEFYEKNETFVNMANEKLQNPLEIELAEDNENLKGLNSINLLFDNIPEEKNQNSQKDFFAQLLESLQARREYIDSLFEKPQEEIMDNYQVYMSKNEEEYQLVSAQKDGFGIFFAESKAESSYLNIESNENGTSISTGYSSVQTTSISTFEAKA